eukprot:gnl/MRDRNA2_/MRDRNA2_19496_c0_seq2.p1 gnl/MRDRNA2_/MRDRNA2_19496_c0~~gnl/MRDRNA2_/MRDRNA2_19496_c0_seq2.p1  ORF type:complete len:260 (+),score=36.58 gnl/MRDRNA2_/MRDRNA2_19496_c0_seq2:248-1027(+)
MLTLFVCLMEGCGEGIIRPVVLATPELIAFWLLFTFLTTLGLLNLIIGLICENAIGNVAADELESQKLREEERARKVLELRQAFLEMDIDQSNDITREEYMNSIHENLNCVDILLHLGLGEEANLFDTLDANRDGSLTFAEFFDGITLLMRGQEVCKAKDVAATHLTCQGVHRCVKRLEQNAQEAVSKKDFERLEATVSGLDTKVSRIDTSVSRIEAMISSLRMGSNSMSRVGTGFSEGITSHTGFRTTLPDPVTSLSL